MIALPATLTAASALVAVLVLESFVLVSRRTRAGEAWPAVDDPLWHRDGRPWIVFAPKLGTLREASS